MSLLSRLKSFCASCFVKDDADRPIFRVLREPSVRRVLEVGIGDARRALRIAQTLTEHGVRPNAEYVGLDLFELMPDDQFQVTLKDAYRLLRRNGLRVQLVPGDPLPTLVERANALGQFHMILFSHGCEPESWPRLWYYLPRLIVPAATVFVERRLEDRVDWQLLDPAVIRSSAATAMRRAA